MSNVVNKFHAFCTLKHQAFSELHMIHSVPILFQNKKVKNILRMFGSSKIDIVILKTAF